MKHVFCSVRHAPPESYGDCVRACIASILNKTSEEVPHFFADGKPGGLLLVREYLKTLKRDIWFTHCPAEWSFQQVMDFVGEANPDHHYMLMPDKHAVVCKGDKKVHDPAWFPVPLDQPSECWVIGIITI